MRIRQVAKGLPLLLEHEADPSLPYVGNPGFGIHCHALDTMNAGFLLANATGKPL